MDHQHCDQCTNANPNKSLCQTLSEMDWERGLWNAAYNGDMKKVQSLIGKSKNVKDTVNAPDNSGYSALHYAVRNGHLDICSTLLQYGADINAQTRTGKATPLHKASAAGNTQAVKFLIQSGAVVDSQDIDGKTALHKAVENKHSEVVNVLLELCPQLRYIKDYKGNCPNV